MLCSYALELILLGSVAAFCLKPLGRGALQAGCV